MTKFGTSRKKVLAAVTILYGLYLLKTMLGINLSNKHSAHWIFKAPLHPIQAGKEHLCQEVQVACIKRKAIRTRLRRGIQKII